MLFIGFSLSDPNFNTIADTVKDSIPKSAKQGTGAEERIIGSSIQLKENMCMKQLIAFLIYSVFFFF
jgi:hypothetical protein